MVAGEATPVKGVYHLIEEDLVWLELHIHEMVLVWEIEEYLALTVS